MAQVNSIRLLYEQEGWSQRRIARTFNLSRNTVVKIINYPDTEDIGKYNLTQPRPCPVMDPVSHIVKSWLLKDETEPRSSST